MSRVVVVAMVAACAAWGPAYAKERYGEWTVEVSDDSEDVYASTVNQDGQVLIRTCNIADNTCAWAFSTNLSCEEGDKYPALGNSSSGAASLMVHCSGKVEDGYVMTFDDFDAAEKLLSGKGIVGIAFPLQSGRFSVFRYSLDGLPRAAAAQIRKVREMQKSSTKAIRL